MPFCTLKAVWGPLANVVEAVYSRIDKIAPCFPLSFHWRVGSTRQGCLQPPAAAAPVAGGACWGLVATAPRSRPRWRHAVAASSTFHIEKTVHLLADRLVVTRAYLAGRLFTSPRLQQAAMGVSSKGSIRAVVTPQHLSLGPNRSLPPPQSEEAFLLAQPQRSIRWKWRLIRSRKCSIRCSARLIHCGRDRITHKDLICDHWHRGALPLAVLQWVHLYS
jgi:hypothetical protein